MRCLIFSLCLYLSTLFNLFAFGGASSEEEFVTLNSDGVVRLSLKFTPKQEENFFRNGSVVLEQPGEETSTGFLISLPNEFKKYEGRVVIACGHSFDLEPNYSILLGEAASKVESMTGNPIIKDYSIHPNYFKDSKFVDLALVLLNDKLEKETLTQITYSHAYLPYKGESKSQLTSWGPYNDNEIAANYKKRIAPLTVKLDEDESANSVKTLLGNTREVVVEKNTTYLSYYYPQFDKISPAIVKEYDLCFSPVCLFPGDSGSRLILENNEPAIACNTAYGDLEGLEESLQEISFLRLEPYKEWISSVVETWSKNKI